jgi:hypothetical protein
MLSEFGFTGRARPFVEIGTGDTRTAGVAVWDGAHWDTPGDVWAGTEPTWVDVSCYVYNYACGYGRSDTLARFLAGTANVVVDNSTGWADPSPAVTPGELSMRPGRQIRMGVVHRGGGADVVFGSSDVVFGASDVTFGGGQSDEVVVLWRGFIDSVVPVYDPVNTDTVELRCIDVLGEVNRAKTKPLPAPAYAGDTADVRIHRLLDAAGWWQNKRDISPTGDTLIGSDMGGQTADLLGQAADSVGGAVFGDQHGFICFRPRDWQTFDPTDPTDATIGNVDPGDVCPVQWERPFERAAISTRVIIGRDPETAVQLDDIDGQARYGIEPFERTNLLTQSDTRLQLLAERVLATRDDSTAPKVRSVTLNAATSDASLDLQATVDPFKPSRYRCRLSLPRGEVFDQQHFVTGVRHTVDRHGWETLVNLDLAGPYAVAGARWDDAYWGQARWTDAVRSMEGLTHVG